MCPEVWRLALRKPQHLTVARGEERGYALEQRKGRDAFWLYWNLCRCLKHLVIRNGRGKVGMKTKLREVSRLTWQGNLPNGDIG